MTVASWSRPWHCFLVRMLVDADEDMPHRFVTITSGDLERLQDEARAARGGPAGIR